MMRLAAAILGVLALAGPAAADAKPVRVLLFAGAATREYQFVRNLLAADAPRFRLAVSLQAPPGRDAPREGVEQGATLLKDFPQAFMHKRTEDLGDQPDEMASYDVVVAFDPDWTRLTADQRKLLNSWVDGGGGLVVVAGPVNTFALAREALADKLRDIRALYPVKVGDNRLVGPAADADNPVALHFPAGDKSPAFLKLDPEGKVPLAGWDDFFFGSQHEKADNVRHGFYGVYPVDSLKPGATAWATLADPKAKLSDGSEAPFLVGQSFGKGRVVYVGSGELWRLRAYRETFYERFWTGLFRYAAAQ